MQTEIQTQIDAHEKCARILERLKRKARALKWGQSTKVDPFMTQILLSEYASTLQKLSA